MERPVGVMIVGQDRLLVEAVVAWLASRPDFQVVETGAPVRPGGVDVVLLDASRRRDEALAVAWRVREELPGAKVLVFGLDREDEEVLAFVEAGALGYLLDWAAATET